MNYWLNRRRPWKILSQRFYSMNEWSSQAMWRILKMQLGQLLNIYYSRISEKATLTKRHCPFNLFAVLEGMIEIFWLLFLRLHCTIKFFASDWNVSQSHEINCDLIFFSDTKRIHRFPDCLKTKNKMISNFRGIPVIWLTVDGVWHKNS